MPEPDPKEKTIREEAKGTNGSGDGHHPRKRLLIASLILLIAVLGLLTAIGDIDTFARNAVDQLAAWFAAEESAPVEVEAPPPAPVSTTFSLRDLDLHPFNVHQPYFNFGTGSASFENQRAFQAILHTYEQRQRIDDNFTIRVTDNRSNEVLEVFTLEAAQQVFQQSGMMDWGKVDRQRSKETKRLSKKYRGLGIPRSAITIKWGRANQVLEARQRENPFIEYELQLARYLGMSLLATEIGTVETFNLDRLVSQVGARSRYQMMPYVLRQERIHHYTLATAQGKQIKVFEEWHPLFTLEPAFLLLRGYVNGVGHEIPGISAYHSGPFNMMKIYRLFLENATSISENTNVVDAFIWALTEGKPTVAKKTSFRSNSQGYVPAIYGSLRATEALPIDTSMTLRAERVQLRRNERIYLSTLLSVLEEKSLNWGKEIEHRSLYNRFRTLNPHFRLPAVADSIGVPPEGDVRLVAAVNGLPVRFFLPLHASASLTDDLAILDEAATFRFDAATYARPLPGEITPFDRAYQQLLQDVSRFGFNRSNRARLEDLAVQFEQLAEENPTFFRKSQRKIIKTHAGLWRSKFWDQVARAIPDVLSQKTLMVRLPVQPPTPLTWPSTTLPLRQIER